uniref:Alpha-1,3-mannosyl-glycoprotein 4-beta-N-acetylglucosaminyltransferase A n=2 Tax=Cyprinus carpio TaxID=7962 RepID=A0A8C1K3B1_CYPCA
MRLRNGTVATAIIFFTSFLSLSWYTAWQNGKEKLVAYQREFHALRERLRAAEHRTLQRSSELNSILEQFRRAIAETNGSKDALSNFSGYWMLTWIYTKEFITILLSLFGCVCFCFVLLSVTLVICLTSRISSLQTHQPVNFYIRPLLLDYWPSPFFNMFLCLCRWRTKQNLDYSFLMMYAVNKGVYYVQLEDDIVAKPNYFATMKNFALQLATEDWMILEFSQLGFIGKMFQAPDLNLIVEFIFMFYKEKPIDWLLDHILWVKVCNPEKDAKHCERQKSSLRIRFRPSLFQHVGLHSSLAGKIQKLTDKDFLKPLLHKIHVNPPAEVSTSLKVYQGHTLDKTYLGEDFFWAITPMSGDYVLFKFDRPVNIERFLFRSGNQEHPGDKIENTTVEILPFSDAELKTKEKYKRTEDRFYKLAQFEKGVAEGTVDPAFNPVVAVRLTVQKDSAVWAIISEIHIKRIPG